jgi:hemoglobin/transferrin/lactoferrin receptor protein
MRRGLLAGTAALATLGWVGAARAEQAVTVAVVDPLTVIATRTEVPLSLAPATVSVITADDIEANLVADIKDLIRMEPGIGVRQSPARFGAAQGATGRDGNSGFNIRGLEGNRVLMLVDGIRQPDAFTFGAQAVGRGDYSDLNLLKTVEILRGPASALYGSDGVAGAVSFTTKDPSDVLAAGRSLGAQLRAGYASADESRQFGAVLASRQGRWSAMLAYNRRDGEAQKTQGETDVANTDRTMANPTDVWSNAILAKAVFQPGGRHRFRAAFEHFDRKIDTDVLSGIAKPPLASTSVIGLLASDTTRRNRGSFDYRFTGGTGVIARGLLSAYIQGSTTVQFTAEDRSTVADRTRRNTFDNRVIGGALELESRFEGAGMAHRVVYGGDVSTTRQEGLRDGTVPPAGEAFPTRAFPNTDYVLAGAYVQDEISLWSGRMSLHPALRYDWYSLDPKVDAALPAFTPSSQSDGHVSPKLGAVLKANETVSLFANYARGFKAPAPSQVNNAFLNPVQNYRSIPNPDLKPETSETVEGGVRLKGGGGGLRWAASVTGYAGWYDDFIDQIQVSGSFTPTNPGVFQVVNLGGVKITGFEARAQVQYDNGLGATFGLSKSKGTTRNAAVRAPLDSVDPLKLTAVLSYRDPGARFGGQMIVIHSAGKSANRVAQACTGGCFLPPDFTTLDLTVYWNVNARVRVNAGVFNLTDAKYWWWNDVRGLSSTAVWRDAYTQPGRNYSVSVSLRL